MGIPLFWETISWFLFNIFLSSNSQSDCVCMCFDLDVPNVSKFAVYNRWYSACFQCSAKFHYLFSAPVNALTPLFELFCWMIWCFHSQKLTWTAKIDQSFWRRSSWTRFPQFLLKSSSVPCLHPHVCWSKPPFAFGKSVLWKQPHVCWFTWIIPEVFFSDEWVMSRSFFLRIIPGC